MPKMTDDEIRTFLDAPGHLLRLATVTEDGWPAVVPIWYIAIDRTLYFSPRERSDWRDNLVANGRACLCIDTYEPPSRRVIIRAEPRLAHPPGEDKEWRDIWWQMALRYMPLERAIWYVTYTADEPRGLYAVDLDAAEVKSWRSPDPSGSEGEEGVWASSYYVGAHGTDGNSG